jgi:hypothetical protein
MNVRDALYQAALAIAEAVIVLRDVAQRAQYGVQFAGAENLDVHDLSIRTPARLEACAVRRELAWKTAFARTVPSSLHCLRIHALC